MVNNKKIGLQIKKARAEAQMTQAEVGKRIGVTWEMISRYENGKSSSRQNLEKISSVLKKPIQYFFGVEELPISDEIRKLKEILERREVEDQISREVPYLESIDEFSIKKAVEFTNQKYICPSWISTKYSEVFALKLSGIQSNVLVIAKNDVAYISASKKPEVGDLVLVKTDGVRHIVKNTRTLNKRFEGVILALEKRLIS